jgi:DNA-binding transcriptional LysR family regulator
VLPFVEHQLAIGIAPKWAAKAGLASGMLTELRMTSVPPPRKLFLAVNEKYPNSSVCSKFIDLLKAGTKEL